MVAGMTKTLLALVLLVVTNLATFGYATWRCRAEVAGHQRLVTDAGTRSQTLQKQVAELQEQLDRVAVWREFVELQRDIAVVQTAINRLNFGDGLSALERIEGRLERGEYGATFQQQRGELQPSLYAARQSLLATDDDARTHLGELEQQAFRLLAAVSESAPATPAATPFPAATPAPSPEASPAAAAPSPSPTASPAATPRGPA
jgi:septal ring factor EnvC (AmiA/AmiB activator)